MKNRSDKFLLAVLLGIKMRRPGQKQTTSHSLSTPGINCPASNKTIFKHAPEEACFCRIGFPA